MIDIYKNLIKLNYTKKEAYELAKQIKNLKYQYPKNHYNKLRDKIITNLSQKYPEVANDFIRN